jgi:hypothetical protein
MKINSAAPELLKADRRKKANFVMPQVYYFVSNMSVLPLAGLITSAFLYFEEQ